jgi:hypothetical protein
MTDEDRDLTLREVPGLALEVTPSPKRTRGEPISGESARRWSAICDK